MEEIKKQNPKKKKEIISFEKSIKGLNEVLNNFSNSLKEKLEDLPNTLREEAVVFQNERLGVGVQLKSSKSDMQTLSKIAKENYLFLQNKSLNKIPSMVS